MNKKAQFFPLKDENPRERFPFVNLSFIAANTIVFVISLSSFEQSIDTYGFKPAEFSILALLTSMFLHGGIAHIFGNMWFLYIFGDNVEDKFGHFRYILFYILAGIAASMLHFVLNINSNIPAVGASGAISGVLGAYIVLFPHAKVYVSGSFGHVGKVSAVFMLGFWFLFQLISGAMSLFGAQSGIAFFAHIGGFVFGAAAAWVYKLTKAEKAA
ncbi:rhomboid family intramembrane serine protease [Candidatus Woesearchaeota archaeon]|nr:rhomboid family intramembrane serine protease [Candidatus Woesearchaeota archaeon]